jgi:hypothetical protein
MTVDGGAAINLMPYSIFKKFQRKDDEREEQPNA